MLSMWSIIIRYPWLPYALGNGSLKNNFWVRIKASPESPQKTKSKENESTNTYSIFAKKLFFNRLKEISSCKFKM